LKELSASKAYK